MALTRVAPAGIGSTPGIGITIGNSFLHTTGLESTNANFSGIVTAQSFRVTGDFQVDGTTTTLDTVVTSVDKLEVGANNNTVGVAITQSGTGDILNLYDGSTQVVTVKDGGRVGIGTNAPTAKLDIRGTVNVSGVSTFQDNVHLGDSDELTFGDDNDLFIYSNGTNGIIRTGSSSNLIYRSATHNFKNQAGTEQLATFTEGGLVGIGTDNPDNLLHLSGTNTTVWPFGSAVSGTYAYSPYPHELQIQNHARDVTGSFAGIYFHSGASPDGSYMSAARIAAIDSGNYRSDLAFGTRNTNFKERLRIRYDGNIGINTTSPSAKLNVVTNNTDDAILMLEADMGTNNNRSLQFKSPATDSAADPFLIKTANSILFQVDSDNVLKLHSNGKVGVGTDSPAYLFDVYKSTGTDQDVFSVRGQTSAFLVQCSDLSATNPTWNLRSFAAEDITIKPGNSESVRFKADGKVGIGTDNPEDDLHVFLNSSGDGPSLRLTNPNGGDGTYTGRISTGDAAGTFFAGINFKKHDSNDGEIRFRTKVAGSNTDVVTIVDGNVGIGTINPNGNFEVFNSNQAVSIVRGDKATLAILGDDYNHGASETDARIILCSDGTISGAPGALTTSPLSAHGFEIALINDEPGSGLRFHDGTANKERLRIKSNGLVGIGTDNPQANLHIFEGTGSTRAPAASGNNLVIDSNSEVGMSLLFGTGANTAYGNIYWGNSTDGSADGRITYFGSTYTTAADRQAMTFRTANTERLRISSAGKLTVTPADTTSSYATTDGGIDIAQTISSTGTSSSQSIGIQFSLTKSGQTGAIAEIGAIREGSGLSGLVFRTRDNSTGRNERLRIRSNGKISAGTLLDTNNSYEFSIRGADDTGCLYAHGRNHYLSTRSNTYASLTLKKSNSDSDNIDYLQLRDSSNAAKLIVNGDGTLQVTDSIKHMGDTDTLISFPANDTITLHTAGSERLRVTSAGLVGIGRDDPSYLLDIRQYTNTTGSTGTTMMRLQNNVGSNSSSLGDIHSPNGQRTFIDFTFIDGNANFTPQVRIGAQVGNTSGDAGIADEGKGSFVVYTGQGTDNAGGGTLTEKLRVTPTGNVKAANGFFCGGSNGAGMLQLGASSGNTVIDTGISVNASNGGGAMMVLASRNTGAGTVTAAGMYLLDFRYDGNHVPGVTFIGGDNFCVFSKNGSNNLTVNCQSGNWSVAAFFGGYGIGNQLNA